MIRLIALVYRTLVRKSLILLVLMTAGPGLDGVGVRAAETQETAREAVERGELIPLSRILALVEKEFPGRVIEVELERRAGRLVYEIEVLQEGGRVVEVRYDGRTGRRLSIDHEDDD